MNWIQFFINNWVGIVALLTLVATIFTLAYIWRENRRYELAVLRSLFQHLNYIKDTSESQYNYLKNKGVPSWTLIIFDLNFYLSRINYRIKVQGLTNEYFYTKELKDLLMRIADSITKINNLFELMYQADLLEEKQRNILQIRYRKELVENNYYQELKEFSYQALSELKSILKPFTKSQLFYY